MLAGVGVLARYSLAGGADRPPVKAYVGGRPTVPGIAILIVSLGFNLLGDGLRDVLDPKQ